ncbi:TMEM165/GDT1 family protein [Sphingomonas sp.]|jgi:putative Ca2+/H+ antiporter (TMEM165/GDT1 family)|uniref:TMEM165/GDT1 family protein n=1 Tax=Sphingomonas sp. TaxID=28214 RepID=UPI002ED8E893
MDALMAALVAAAAAQVGDRTAWLAAILADRWRRPGLVIITAALGLLAASGIAAAGGALIAPTIAPQARQLLLALALLLQGAGSFFPAKMPDRLTGWRIGAGATTFLGMTILAFGDGIQFIVAALAARTTVPALAAIGATLGSLAIIAPAALLGEAAWLRLPLHRARMVIGAAFLILGATLALGALGLV